jgi:hypothetical protein
MKVTKTTRTEGTIEEIAEAVRRTICHDLSEEDALDVASTILGHDFQRVAGENPNAEPVFFYEESESGIEA